MKPHTTTRPALLALALAAAALAPHARAITGAPLPMPATPTKPAITQQPVATTAAAGAITTFTIAATANPAPAYQWQVSPNGSTWTNVPNVPPYVGALTPTLTIQALVTAWNGYHYRCVVTNSLGSATTNTVTYTTSTPPVITGQTVGATITEGQTATFTIAATGNPAPTYQWYEQRGNAGGWKKLSNTGNYSGVTTNKLAIASVSSALNGSSYYCVANNTAGAANSTPAPLAVNPIPAATKPVITKQPASVTIPANQGQNATFTTAATGTPTLYYEWLYSKDGATWNVVANNALYSGYTGADTPTLTLSKPPATLAGTQYKCFVSTMDKQNTYTTPTNIVTLTITTPKPTPAAPAQTALGSLPTTIEKGQTLTTLAPVITAQPAPATLTAGQTATFTITATDPTTLAYQWQFSKDGLAPWTNLNTTTPIDGATCTNATTRILTISTTTTASNGGSFRCLVTNTARKTTTSTPAKITINAPPFTAGSAIIFPAYQFLGSTAAGLAYQANGQIIVASGTGTLAYCWVHDGVPQATIKLPIPQARAYDVLPDTWTIKPAATTSSHTWNLRVTSPNELTSPPLRLTVPAATTQTTGVEQTKFRIPNPQDEPQLQTTTSWLATTAVPYLDAKITLVKNTSPYPVTLNRIEIQTKQPGNVNVPVATISVELQPNATTQSFNNRDATGARWQIVGPAHPDGQPPKDPKTNQPLAYPQIDVSWKK